MLADKVIGIAAGFGSMVEIKAEDAIILLGEGVDNFSSESKRITALLKFENEPDLTEKMYGLVGKCVLYNGVIKVKVNM